jgi:hypothetical protein
VRGVTAEQTLTHSGKVSHELAEERAHQEFEKYDKQRFALEASQPSSDFDELVEESRHVQGQLPTPLTQIRRRKRGSSGR